MHQLYPIVEIVTVVPLGTGNSAYIFPEVPTIGFESGKISSSIGARGISTAMGLILKDSYAKNGMKFAPGDTNGRFQPTFVTATRYGMLSKSLAVKSSSPLALAFARVSLISARSFSWQSRCLANSQSPKVS